MRLLSAIMLSVIASWTAFGQTYTISTLAGGGLPVNIQGTSASLYGPAGVAVDRAGNIFFVDGNTILRLDSTSGVLTLFAGVGARGFSGDNGPATSAVLNLYPSATIVSPYLYVKVGIAVDSTGNVYIADIGNNRIRMISGGIITTVATGVNDPGGLAVDSAGNLYIADTLDNRVLKVTNGVITTVAGNGMPCPCSGANIGDNGPATSAGLYWPQGVAVDSLGNLYIADTTHSRIRKVANGIITTVAGNGMPTGLYPSGVAAVSAGSIYIADSFNGRILMISSGVITTIAGNGIVGFSGDSGLATSAQIGSIDVTLNAAGDLYLADAGNYRLRKVSGGIITTVAGNGTQEGHGGDSGPATSAQLSQPLGVAVDTVGNVYIADTQNSRIRKVANGVITTVAGNGTSSFGGDNGLATNAQLNHPQRVAVDSVGNLYIADTGNQRIRRVSNGVITTVAGNGIPGFSGDNGPALNAQLKGPQGIALDATGNLYIADTLNNVIRKVSSGVINTVAGQGSFGLESPADVAVDGGGNLYILEPGPNVLEMTHGVIVLIHPFSPNGDSGDERLYDPDGIAVDGAGTLYISDTSDQLIRKISNGVITTIAGDGTAGFSGDNGPSIGAQVNSPQGIAVSSTGTLYVADELSNRIRELVPAGPPCSVTSVSPVTLALPPAGGKVNITIATGPSCSWAIAPIQFGFITYMGYAGGAVLTGAATITLAIAPNLSTFVGVTATILIAGVPVTITEARAGYPMIAPGGVVPVYSSVPTIQPGSWISIYGTNLALGTATWDGTFPTSLLGTQVTVGGQLGYLWYVSPGQINLQAPDGPSDGGPVNVYVITPIGPAQAGVGLAPQAPAFSLLGDGVHVAGEIATPNGSGAYGGGTYDLAGPSGIFSFNTRPVKTGETLTLYGVGFGPTTPAVPAGKAFSGAAPTKTPVTITIGGANATVSFAGITEAGLYQFNLVVPPNTGSGDQSLQATVNGVQTPSGPVVTVQ